MQAERVFLVERYLQVGDDGVLVGLAERLAESAAAMRGEGHRVEWLRSLGLPGDEMCLCLFRAADEASVAELNRRANAEYERISAALALGEL